MLDCYVCSTSPSSDDNIYCPACARAALYPVRIRHSKVLLAQESFRRQVDVVVAGRKIWIDRNSSSGTENLASQECAKQFQYQETLAKTAELKERFDRVVEQSEVLKEHIRQYRTAISERKEISRSRRASLVSAISVLATVQTDAIIPLKKSIRKISHRHENLYSTLVSSRIYLCSEAAALLGLHRMQETLTSGKTVESFVLGGGNVVDLRDLNNHTHFEIAASLNNISHLLYLVCYYLGVRLPAEIAIPGEGRPSATVYQPFSSYLFYNHPKHFSISSHAIHMFGPQNLENIQEEFPRARLLEPDRRLVLLAREDPMQYSLCVEGISLLAWDVAWLCRTQGLQVASENWEELCNVGRNLWLLLNATTNSVQMNSTTMPVSSNRAAKRPPLKPSVADLSHMTDHMLKDRSDAQRNPLSTLGQLSHGTTYGFLGSTFSTRPSSPNNGSEAWKFASPVSVIDKFKSILLAELSGLEWELLDEADFEVGEDRINQRAIALFNEETNVIGSVTDQVNVNDEQRTGLGISTPISGDLRRGTSGWTKLKSRAKSQVSHC